MDTHPKRTAALELLATTGIWRSTYEPSYVRLLWRLGIDARPPHFASFWRNALGAGLYFAVVWGLVMWLVVWQRLNMSAVEAVLASATAGLFFGLAMGGYYAYGRRKHGLPSWEELSA
jgi:hypothetical protein